MSDDGVRQDEATDERARLVIVCGLPGSGKTTLARQLEADLPAVRFCPDEWMAAYGISLFDHAFRADVEAAQWALAQELLRRGRNVIIEWGTWPRAERDDLRRQARALGVAVELRYLSAPFEVLVQRVEDRGADGEAGSVPLTREHLDEYVTMFDEPDADELAQYDPPRA